MFNFNLQRFNTWSLSYASDKYTLSADGKEAITTNVDLSTVLADSNVVDGDTIQLSGNISVSKTVTIDKNLILDLNGKTFTSTVSGTSKALAADAIKVKEGKTFSIQDNPDPTETSSTDTPKRIHRNNW